MARPGWGLFNTSSTDMNFTVFDWLSSILHPRFSSCKNEGKLWDYCTFSTVLCNSTVAFSWGFQTTVTKLLLWPAYLTFDRWLQWTSSSITPHLWKQHVRILSTWGLWKASELPWAFLRQQMSNYPLKHTTVKLGQEGTEDKNGLS